MCHVRCLFKSKTAVARKIRNGSAVATGNPTEQRRHGSYPRVGRCLHVVVALGAFLMTSSLPIPSAFGSAGGECDTDSIAAAGIEIAPCVLDPNVDCEVRIVFVDFSEYYSQDPWPCSEPPGGPTPTTLPAWADLVATDLDVVLDFATNGNFGANVQILNLHYS